MADFSFLSDTDEAAVEQILTEAMDHCVLEQVSALNCASFQNSVLPSNLESRFQRLKTFPSSSSVSSSSHSKSLPKSQLAPDSAANKSKNSVNELKNSAEKPFSNHSRKTTEKGRDSGGKSLSGSSSSSSGQLNYPNFRAKQGDKKGKDENFLSRSLSFGSNSSASSTKSVKMGCFGCSPKRISKKKSSGNRNELFELGDDWGKHDELLSDLKSFSEKKQKNLMKIAKMEEKKINKEAEKIVKWAKQASARMEFSGIIDDDDDLSDDNNHGHNFGRH